jgi:IclR family pca regulon transcriptional regulator
MRTHVHDADDNAFRKDAVSTPPSHAEDFVQSLARGLAVIATFSEESQRLTLSAVARRTGLSRGTARRFLLTLRQLGYVGSEGDQFFLTPRVMRLGYAYLSSMPLWQLAEPLVDGLRHRSGGSCSIAVLDGREIVYVVRCPSRSIVRDNFTLGTRLPAYLTGLGRALLAGLSDQALDAYLEEVQPRAFSEFTITDKAELRRIIIQAREQGWANADRQADPGLRSIAAPIKGRDGRVIAAVNISVQTARVQNETLIKDFLPTLISTAEEISSIAAMHPS